MMANLLEDLPIRPAFGTLRGVMEGVVKNSKPVGDCEWIAAQPPAHLLPIHRPARISAIWGRILELLRDPVEVHQLADGRKVFHVLATAVLVRGSRGSYTSLLWGHDGLDRAHLDRLDDRSVILQGMPWKWLWLDRLLDFAKLEYQEELGFLNIDAEGLDDYFNWLSQLIRRRIASNADMRQVRQRIRTTIGVDVKALRRAHAGVVSGRDYTLASLREYNNAVLMDAELDQLESDSPHLLPLYMAMAPHGNFPGSGDPVQRLKKWLLSNGFKPRDWRFVYRCNRRLIAPMGDVYYGRKQCAETLDYLRTVCALGLKEQCPERLIRALFGAWGNPAQREMTYWNYVSRFNFYPHFMALAVKRFATIPWDQLEGEFLSIVRWARDVSFSLTKGQKRLGWDWLLQKANAYSEMVQAKKSLDEIGWDVPTKGHVVGDYQLRFLESSYDLWDESIQMRNCVDVYSDKCRHTNARIASVTVGRRRVATAMFVWSGEELKLVQISGKANRPVSDGMTKRLNVVHIPGASENFKKIPCQTQVLAQEECAVSEPIAAVMRNCSQARKLSLIHSEKSTMTATITNTGVYIREVEISPVQAIADTFHMEFRSRLLTAKNPKESQRNFSLMFEREGLLELKALIDRALQ